MLGEELHGLVVTVRRDVDTNLAESVDADGEERMGEIRDDAAREPRAGERRCLECGGAARRTAPAAEAPWRCDGCGTDGVPIEPRHLVGSPLSLCRRCLGRGFERSFIESKLIRRPEEPVCGRCLHSPGYYPKSYMCTPGTGLHPRLLAFPEGDYLKVVLCRVA